MSEFIEDLKTNTVAAWPMVMLRVSVGIMFVIAGYGKAARGAGFGDGMVGFLNGQQNMFGFYRGFVESVVIPNKVLFGYLVAYGELIGGVALILGLFTRWTSLAVALMVANFWFAKGAAFWSPSNHDSLYILIALALVFTRSGETFGLDGVLARRRVR